MSNTSSAHPWILSLTVMHGSTLHLVRKLKKRIFFPLAFVGDVTQHQLNSIFRAADASHEVTSEHHLKTTRNVCQDDHRGTAKARKIILGFALIASQRLVY